MAIDFEFLSQLRQLASRVRGADPALNNLALFRTPTDAELSQVRQSTLALLLEASNSANELLDELLPRLDGTGLEDLAALVDGEVRSDLERINALESDSTAWQIGISAVEILSKLLKAAAAVENAYCQDLGLESEISHVAEVETAIEIREAYTKFWRSVGRGSAETEPDAERRFRSASTAIARLCGRSTFLDIRALDRKLVLGLQRRIQEYLCSDGTTENGDRLWEDVMSFAELLRMINFRAELLQHDSLLLPELMAQVGDLTEETIDLGSNRYLCTRIRRLLGRNPELDDMILDRGRVPSHELLELLGEIEISILVGLPRPLVI